MNTKRMADIARKIVQTNMAPAAIGPYRYSILAVAVAMRVTVKAGVQPPLEWVHLFWQFHFDHHCLFFVAWFELPGSPS